jgi:dinuclear metal center YbgI/SA1388 family protein
MLTAALTAALESIAPPRLAEDWDNVGLLIGAPDAPLTGPVLLTIDLTEAVLDEAERLRAGAIIAYHPPIFRPIKRIVGGSAAAAAERVIHRAARAGLAVYSPHTALDACTGGITDWLAEGLMGPGDGGGGDKRALQPALRRERTQEVKIVTFVPHEHLDTVRAAMASAGAGLIGAYELCSFSLHGVGTFRGAAGTRPAVGQAEQFEQVSEHRLEMVCSRSALALVLQTLRQFHPYEEPAIDIYPLEPRPERGIGAGRRITLDHPCSLADLAKRLKLHLGVSAVQLAAVGGRADAMVERIGVVPGAGGSLAAAALADGCQLFVTGEMKHHEVHAALGQGLSVLLGGHTATERGYLPRLAARLAALLPESHFVVSTADRDPLVLL